MLSFRAKETQMGIMVVVSPARTCSPSAMVHETASPTKLLAAVQSVCCACAGAFPCIVPHKASVADMPKSNTSLHSQLLSDCLSKSWPPSSALSPMLSESPPPSSALSPQLCVCVQVVQLACEGWCRPHLGVCHQVMGQRHREPASVCAGADGRVPQGQPPPATPCILLAPPLCMCHVVAMHCCCSDPSLSVSCLMSQRLVCKLYMLWWLGAHQLILLCTQHHTPC